MKESRARFCSAVRHRDHVTHAQTAFVFERVLLTGAPAPGLEPALVDEIGVHVDIFNDDLFAGGPQIGPGGATGIAAQVGGDGRPSTRDGSGSGASGHPARCAMNGSSATARRRKRRMG